eukprot:CAMPEP_0119153094 /NCGR_PEP_ID=MMETSP1310-20130426/48727_1 /TAXON_ID=464262 /ORGANISM="Genus nov. species nov., Strain RCC2339" /LENGTH=422 /DNA_ID=CAMNT_0007145515 /DNA_START=223 /DNA_END=1492 /DNA_ORIENTATION=-
MYVSFGGLSNSMGFILHLVDNALKNKIRPLLQPILGYKSRDGTGKLFNDEFALLLGIPDDIYARSCNEGTRGEFLKLAHTGPGWDVCACKSITEYSHLDVSFPYTPPVIRYLRGRFREGSPLWVARNREEFQQVLLSMSLDRTNIVFHYRLGDTDLQYWSPKRGSFGLFEAMVIEMEAIFTRNETRCFIVTDTPLHPEVSGLVEYIRLRLCTQVLVPTLSPVQSFAAFLAADLLVIQNSGFARLAAVLRPGPTFANDLKWQNISAVPGISVIKERELMVDNRHLWYPKASRGNSFRRQLDLVLEPDGITWRTQVDGNQAKALATENGRGTPNKEPMSEHLASIGHTDYLTPYLFFCRNQRRKDLTSGSLRSILILARTSLLNLSILLVPLTPQAAMVSAMSSENATHRPSHAVSRKATLSLY